MKSETVNARFLENDCEDCLNDLLEESKRFGGLPLAGKVVLIPRNWLGRPCPHGRLGLKFVEARDEPSSEPESSDERAQPSEPD
jgi:hypothetical protein